jgi:voltage-gated potassium channel Kch
MTTVGYGDVYAVTTFGRMTTIIIALSGTIMISLLVATMAEQFNLRDEETRVLNEI